MILYDPHRRNAFPQKKYFPYFLVKILTIHNRTIRVNTARIVAATSSLGIFGHNWAVIADFEQ